MRLSNHVNNRALATSIFLMLAFMTADSRLAAQTEREFNEHLTAFAPYVGQWTCDSKWQAGSEFWAQNDYSVGMNGNFLKANTSTKNASGGIYQRYETTWLYDQKEERLETYGFAYDGTVTRTYPEIVQVDDKHPIIRSAWQQPDGSFIKQEVQMDDGEKSYQWRVWSSSDEKEWALLMDGVWNKSE